MVTAKGIGSPSVARASVYEEYPGWLTTADGPKMDDAQLDEIRARILLPKINSNFLFYPNFTSFSFVHSNRTDIIWRAF